MSERHLASFQRLQPAVARIARGLDECLSLARLSASAGLSPLHFQRVFAGTVGESPKQFTRRLRLSRAAAMLVSGRESILDVALACGFGSHEGFTRTFVRHFGLTPQAYRRRGLAGQNAAADAVRHAAIVSQVGPCIGLFHAAGGAPVDQGNLMTYSIVRKDLAPQTVLVSRRRVPRAEIAAAISSVLPAVFGYAQQHGMALASHPFTRYVESGPGMVTIEPGMQVLNAKAGAGAAAPGADRTGVVEDLLPGGSAAVTVHRGPYDSLANAYAALEIWIAAQGLEPAGSPWEYYVTDPADFPDPKDWQTEVCWPVRE